MAFTILNSFSKFRPVAHQHIPPWEIHETSFSLKPNSMKKPSYPSYSLKIQTNTKTETKIVTILYG